MNKQNLKVGDNVRVKQGVIDPDTEIYDMSHWQGRITNIEEEDKNTLITIAWDSITLEELPKDYIRFSIEEGYSFEEMRLYPEDVEKTKSRDSLTDVERVAEEIYFDNIELAEDEVIDTRESFQSIPEKLDKFRQKKLLIWLFRTVITAMLYVVFWQYTWVRWSLIIYIPLSLFNLFLIVGSTFLLKKKIQKIENTLEDGS